MSFHWTSSNIRIFGATLLADCSQGGGNAGTRASSLPLDLVLGNIDGDFVWGLTQFSGSARNLWLENGHVLHAQLANRQGQWIDSSIDLDEKITNRFGFLEAPPYVKWFGGKDPSTWCSALNPSKLISELSIPGTHDSATYVFAGDSNVFFEAAKAFAVCQGLNIQEQLQFGIRYLDLRAAIGDSGDLYISHTFMSLVKLESIFSQIYGFLDQNPKEFVLVQIAQDNTLAGTPFGDKVLDLINKASNRWSLAEDIPTVGAIQGRIQLVRRFDTTSQGPAGLDVRGWASGPPSGAKISFNVQDDFNLQDKSLDVKEGEVNAQLTKAATDSQPNTLYLNFVSTTQWGVTNEISQGMIDYVIPAVSVAGGLVGYLLGQFAKGEIESKQPHPTNPPFVTACNSSPAQDQGMNFRATKALQSRQVAGASGLPFPYQRFGVVLFDYASGEMGEAFVKLACLGNPWQ